MVDSPVEEDFEDQTRKMPLFPDSPKRVEQMLIVTMHPPTPISKEHLSKKMPTQKQPPLINFTTAVAIKKIDERQK